MTSNVKYSPTAVFLHWAIAVLIIANVILGLTAGWVSDVWVRPIIDLHKSLGISILILAIIRLGWRFSHQPPPLLASLTHLEKILAHGVHVLLYLVLFLQPLTGWVHDSAWSVASSHTLKLFGFIPWFRLGFISNLDPATKESLHTLFGNLHSYCSYFLYAALALHLAGALKHQFIDRQKEIQRMWW